MTLPNAIIAGVNKAGTTSLFHALAANPEVLPSTVKETHFFDPLKYGQQLPTLGEYAAHFPESEGQSVVLEATPGYFYGGRRVAETVDHLLPGVRIVIVLREPGSRAYSWWRFCRSRLLVDPGLPFQDYLEKCRLLGPAPEESPSMVGWRALSGSTYSRYLPHWQRVFGDRLLILFYDDLMTNPSGAESRICDHLGIPAHTRELARHDNRTTDIKNRRLQRVALAVNRMGEPLWRAAPRVKSAVRSGYYAVNAQRSQDRLDDAARAWLTDYFDDEVHALAELLGSHQSVPGWLSGLSR